ncbi:hypothetical protein HDU76_013858 [Blyttiomyces sp. JEL0837]|nr:hypothetical protein HDU76_013858 [Blyttiomyces sp. JEL0837]
MAPNVSGTLAQQQQPLAVSDLLSRFPPPPFHVPPTNMQHVIPAHLRTTRQNSGRSTLPRSGNSSAQNSNFNTPNQGSLQSTPSGSTENLALGVLPNKGSITGGRMRMSVESFGGSINQQFNQNNQNNMGSFGGGGAVGQFGSSGGMNTSFGDNQFNSVGSNHSGKFGSSSSQEDDHKRRPSIKGLFGLMKNPAKSSSSSSKLSPQPQQQQSSPSQSQTQIQMQNTPSSASSSPRMGRGPLPVPPVDQATKQKEQQMQFERDRDELFSSGPKYPVSSPASQIQNPMDRMYQDNQQGQDDQNQMYESSGVGDSYQQQQQQSQKQQSGDPWDQPDYNNQQQNWDKENDGGSMNQQNSLTQSNQTWNNQQQQQQQQGYDEDNSMNAKQQEQSLDRHKDLYSPEGSLMQSLERSAPNSNFSTLRGNGANNAASSSAVPNVEMNANSQKDASDPWRIDSIYFDSAPISPIKLDFEVPPLPIPGNNNNSNNGGMGMGSFGSSPPSRPMQAQQQQGNSSLYSTSPQSQVQDKTSPLSQGAQSNTSPYSTSPQYQGGMDQWGGLPQQQQGNQQQQQQQKFPQQSQQQNVGGFGVGAGMQGFGGQGQAQGQLQGQQWQNQQRQMQQQQQQQMPNIVSPSPMSGSPPSAGMMSPFGSNTSGNAGLSPEAGAELLYKACGGSISFADKDILFGFLKGLNPVEASKLQRRTQAALSSPSNPNRFTSAIEIDKYVLDFKQFVPIQMNVEVTETITLVAKTPRPNFRIIVDNQDPKFSIRVDPTIGSINGMMAQIKVTLQIKGPVVVNTVLTLDIENGSRHFILVKPTSASALTAAGAVNASSTGPQQQLQQSQPPQQQQQNPPSTSDDDILRPGLNFGNIPKPAVTNDPMMEIQVEDIIISGFPHRVPKSLAMLRATLMARDGLLVDGIFRDKGEESEIKMIRERIRRGQPFRTLDMLAVATVIKIYFREMPKQLLNDIPNNVIMDSYDEDQAWNSLNVLSPQNRDLLEWVLDLMSDVVYYEADNHMGLRSICTVMAPNLYGPASDSQSDMMEYMTVSIQLPHFLGMLLTKRIRILEE